MYAGDQQTKLTKEQTALLSTAQEVETKKDQTSMACYQLGQQNAMRKIINMQENTVDYSRFSNNSLLDISQSLLINVVLNNRFSDIILLFPMKDLTISSCELNDYDSFLSDEFYVEGLDQIPYHER